MTKQEHLEKVITENMDRVNRIFRAVDFRKVGMTAELIRDMIEVGCSKVTMNTKQRS